jgi:purine-binding chemotaxis protein CheW
MPASPRAPKLSRQALVLKSDFDRSFAEPMRPSPPQRLDLLRIRLGGDPWAVPLTDVAGLHSGRRITPVPGRTPALLGLAGFRGVLAAVYDLPALIGLAPLGAARWLLLAEERRVAFAFSDLDGHLRVEVGAILPLGAENGSAWARGFIEDGEVRRPILHLPALLARIGPRHQTAQEGNDI